LVTKQKKLELQNALPDQTLKKTTIIFVKIRKKKERKEIKRMRGCCGCEGEREENRERMKNTIYTKYSCYLYILGYTSWVKMTRF
jgi:AMMECR1 domain-containing protein